MTNGLPKNWINVSVGQLCEAINGRAFKKSEWRQEGLPILRIQNLKDPDASFNYFEGTIDSRHVVQTGDLLFAWSGTPGTSFGAFIWSGPTGALNQHIFRLDFDPDVVAPQYFCHALNQKVANYIEQAQGGVGLAHITKSKFMASTVPLAPAAEQARIVDEVELQSTRLNSGVAALKRVEANLKRYKASVLKAACEGKLTERWRQENPDVEPASELLKRILKERRRKWEEAELAKMITKGKPPKDDKWKKKYKQPKQPDTNNLPALPRGWTWTSMDSVSFVTKLAGFEYTKFVTYSDDGDLPVIKAENASREGFRVTDFSHIDSSSVANLTRSQLRGGELLMVFVGAGVATVARVPSDREYFLGPNIAMMRIESNCVTPQYLEYFLRSPVGFRLGLSFAKSVAQPSLSMGTIRQIPIAIPPFEEQELVVDALDRDLMVAKTQLEAVTIAISRSASLRQSILKRAFEGKLVEQYESDESAQELLQRIKAERETEQAKSNSKRKGSKRVAANTKSAGRKRSTTKTGQPELFP